MATNATDPDVTFTGEELPPSSSAHANPRSRMSSESSVKSIESTISESGKVLNPTCSNLNKRLKGMEKLLKEVEEAGLAAELLAKVKGEFSLLQVRIDHLTTSNAVLHSAEQALQSQLSSLTEQNTQLRADAHTYAGGITKLSLQVTQVKSSNALLEQHVSTLKAEVLMLQSANTLLDADNRQLIQSDAEQKSKIIIMERKIVEYECKVNAKDVELVDFQRQIRDHSETLQGLQRQIDELKAQSTIDKDLLRQRKSVIDNLTVELQSIPLPEEMEDIVRNKQLEEFRLTREEFDRDAAKLDAREAACDERERELLRRETLLNVVPTPSPPSAAQSQSKSPGQSRANLWNLYKSTATPFSSSSTQPRGAEAGAELNGDSDSTPKVKADLSPANVLSGADLGTGPTVGPQAMFMDPHVAAALEIARLAVANSRPAESSFGASSKTPASSDLRDLPRFDGSKKLDQLNIYAFFDNVDAHKRVKKWDEPTAAGVLNLIFEGEARAKFEALDHSVRDCYPLAKQKMIELYSTETTRLSFQSQFHSRNQKITESWDAYLIDLKSIARQAFRGPKEDIELQYVFPRFMSGLNQDARIFIRPFKPITLDEVVTALQEYDAAKGVDPPSATAPPRLAAASARAPGAPSFGSRQQQLNNNRQNSGFVPTCYNCGAPGHFSRDCHASRKQITQLQPAPFQHQRAGDSRNERGLQNDSSQQQNRRPNSSPPAQAPSRSSNRNQRQGRYNDFRNRRYDDSRRGAGVFNQPPMYMDGSPMQQQQPPAASSFQPLQHAPNQESQSMSAFQPYGQGNETSGALAQPSGTRRE